MSDAQHTARQALTELCQPIAGLDLSSPERAEAALRQRFPLSSLGELEQACRQAWEEGRLTPRQASPEVHFGRVAKPGEATHGLSIDAVEMGGLAAAHTHPRGEVSLCFATKGEDPRFMGKPAGWVVEPPGSHHVPTVTGGRMLIVYFLPGGEMIWG